MTISNWRLISWVLCGILVSGVAAQNKKAKTTPDGRFVIELDHARLPVISQDRTGTCWSFATVSFLESELGRIHGKPVDLSEMYPVYFTYLEKARRFVKHKGKSRFSEGGLSHDVIEMIKQYGLVPGDAYSGLCPGDRRHNHGEMAKVLEAVSRQLVKNKRAGPKWEAAMRGILDAYIGAVPTSVTVKGRKMTPQEYALKELKVPCDDYVEVMSWKYLPFGSQGELTVPDNWMHDARYINVPLEDMMAGMDHALKAGYSVAVDMDVSEKGFLPPKGVAQLGEDLEKPGAVNQDVREEHFKDGRTTDDHLMHVVGMATDKDGGTWYMTKNSWGDKLGYGGYLFMSRNFMAMKMLAFMVHRDGLPKNVLGVL